MRGTCLPGGLRRSTWSTVSTRAGTDARRGRPLPDRRGPSSTSVGGPRRRTSACTTAWKARPSRCGPRTPVPLGWWATGTAGTAASDPMRPLGVSGVWELFVPGIGAGARYKFELETRDGAAAPQGRPDGTTVRGAAGHGQRRDASPSTSGATATGCGAASRRDPLKDPLRVFEVHLGSWRPGLDYREAAHQLADYVGRPRLHARRAAPRRRAPLRRLVGLPGHRVLRADARGSARPTTSATSSTTSIGSGIGVIVDWVPAHFPKDDWALARFDGTALYEHHDPRLGEHPDWGTLVFNYGRNEVKQLPAGQRRSTGSTSSTSTGCGSTRWRRCSTSTTPASPDEWLPNEFGGRENLEAIEFIKEMNTVVFAEHPGVMTIAEESTSWPMVTPARRPRRARVHPQVEHGLDARHARLLPARPGASSASTTASSPSGCCTRSPRTSCCPLSHDEVVHGKGSLLDQDARRRVAALRQPALAVRLDVGLPGRPARCSWAARSPSGPSGTRSAASTGRPSTARSHRGRAGAGRGP